MNSTTKISNNNAHRPLVSVVMIAYNSERYIDDAIRGVIAQKGDFDIQLIICDDCSKDSTAAIVEQWTAKYPTIIDFHRNEKNLGVQGNYLEAFKYVKGDYMAMCDADDYWIDSSKLARQVGYMESHPDCSITFHRVINYYEDSRVKSFSNGGQKADATFDDISRSNFITNMSVLYRRKLVDLTQLPEWLNDVRLVDYPMHMFYAAKGKIHYFNRPMGVYRQSESAIWSMAQQIYRQEMALLVRLHLLEYFSDKPVNLDGLRVASKNILVAMIADAPENSHLKEVLHEYMQKIDPLLTEEALNFEASKRKQTAKAPFTKRLSRNIRIAVSRLLPVPRPPKV